MFPDFRYLIHGLFGVQPPEWLHIFKTFGLMVALAFIGATMVMVRELKRKEGQGLIKPQVDPKKKELVYPHQRISEIVMIAAIFGLIGAKIFNALETWSDFIKDPISNLFSPSGLTFYGGLITATAVFYYYARKHKIRFVHLCDAAAPAIMLAYGIGRMGCQLAGDGDWGIYNSAYVTQATGTALVRTAGPGDFKLNAATDEHGNPVIYGSRYVPGPAWLPRSFVAQNFPHNIIGEGRAIPGDTGEYHAVLPYGVFPTSLYEFFAGILLFGVMWSVRKRIKQPFHMFGLYLILAGIERFFVEQFRVNTKYDLGFIHPTQAEIISVVLMILGVCIFAFYRFKPKAADEEPAPQLPA